MKFKKIALITCVLVVFIFSLWVIYENVKESQVKKAHSLMAYTTMDIYQMMNDSALFQIEAVFHEENGRCMYKSGNDYIVGNF